MEAPVTAHHASRSAEIAYFLVNLMLVLLLIGATVELVSASVGLARGGNTLLGGRTFRIDAKLPREQVKGLPPGVKLTHDPTVTLELKDPSDGQLLLTVATAVGPFVLLAAGLWLLRGLARSVLEGDPFGTLNVRRLRVLGFLLMVGGPVVALVNWGLRHALADTLPAGAFGNAGFPGFRFPFVVVLVGLGVFILGEVFAHGVRLREDVEATI
jgi:hypothetical protein